MENASKALIIAGAVLIALLIVSLGVMVYNNMSEKAKDGAELDKQKIAAFNGQFEGYIGKNVSGSKVNALVELVRTINNECIRDNDYSKKVELTYENSDDDVGGFTIGVNSGNLTESGNITRVETGASKHYKVEASYGDNGLVNKIKITNN